MAISPSFPPTAALPPMPSWERAGAYVDDPLDLVPGNTVRLLRNGAEVYPAWLDAIDAARKRVSMEMYIFNDSKIGRRIADALSCAARRGVAVRLLYDFIGCRHAPAEFFHSMRRAGVFTLAYHPYRLWRPKFWTLIRRNHRKTLVCDSEVAFTGGVNISDEWLPQADGGGGWHDAAVELRGPAVGLVERAFLRTWNRRAKRRLRLKPGHLHRPLAVGEVPVAVIANHEILDRFAIRRAALQAVHASRERILLASPYFIPDPGVLHSIRRAAIRGCDVRILVPHHSDSATADFASRASFGRLLRAGVRIFQHSPMVHMKALVVDRDFVSLGSYNFDHRSLAYNLELVVNCLDPEFNKSTGEMLMEDIAESDELLWEDFKNRPLFTRICERLAYSLRHWL